jgi:hypothetical protein
LADRRRAAVLCAAGALALSAAAGARAEHYYVPPADGPAVENPCGDERAKGLDCPDLKMAKPRGMSVDHNLLRAETNIESRGRGPMQIRGNRSGRRRMDVKQIVHKRGHGVLRLPTHAILIFYSVPGQGRYWKMHHAASMELHEVEDDGDIGELVRRGPKLNYCLRDLQRTRHLHRSPHRRRFPGCSQDPHIKHRTLGTSVGWSDIYPASYDKNWVNVHGLHGCFWFVNRADPENYLYESDELNNAAARKVRLPARGGHVRRC